MDALRELRDQGKVRFWGMTAVGETESLHRVIDSAAGGVGLVCRMKRPLILDSFVLIAVVRPCSLETLF